MMHETPRFTHPGGGRAGFESLGGLLVLDHFEDPELVCNAYRAASYKNKELQTFLRRLKTIEIAAGPRAFRQTLEIFIHRVRGGERLNLADMESIHREVASGEAESDPAESALEELANTANFLATDERPEYELRDELEREFRHFVENHGWTRKDDGRFKNVIVILQHFHKAGAIRERDLAARLVRADLPEMEEWLRAGRLAEIRRHAEGKRAFYAWALKALRCSYIERIFPSDRIGGIHASQPVPEYARLLAVFEAAGAETINRAGENHAHESGNEKE